VSRWAYLFVNVFTLHTLTFICHKSAIFWSKRWKISKFAYVFLWLKRTFKTIFISPSISRYLHFKFLVMRSLWNFCLQFENIVMSFFFLKMQKMRFWKIPISAPKNLLKRSLYHPWLVEVLISLFWHVYQTIFAL
jgi:hypothetical protein